MTVKTAISTLSSVGEVRCVDGQIRCRIPKRRPAEVQLALAVVSSHKAEVLALLSKQPDPGKWALNHVVHVAGGRIVRHHGEYVLAVWNERRGYELCLALRILGLGYLALVDREH